MTIADQTPLLRDKQGRTFHEKFRMARLLAGLDQQEVATALKVSRNAVSSWERGVNEPSATSFVRFARLTGQSLEWFAEGVNDETASPEGEAVSGSVRPKGFEPPTF